MMAVICMDYRIEETKVVVMWIVSCGVEKYK